MFCASHLQRSWQASAGCASVPSLLVFAYAAATTKRAIAEFPVVRAESQDLKFSRLWGHIRSRNPRTQFAQLLPASEVSVLRNQNTDLLGARVSEKPAA